MSSELTTASTRRLAAAKDRAARRAMGKPLAQDDAALDALVLPAVLSASVGEAVSFWRSALGASALGDLLEATSDE